MKCGHANRAAARFCAGCGHAAIADSAPVAPALQPATTSDHKACTRCGIELAAETRFCKSCGNTVISSAASELAANTPAAQEQVSVTLHTSPAPSLSETARASEPFATGAASPKATPHPQVPDSPQGKHRLMMIFGAVAVVVVAIGALVAYRFMQPSPSEVVAAPAGSMSMEQPASAATVTLAPAPALVEPAPTPHSAPATDTASAPSSVVEPETKAPPIVTTPAVTTVPEPAPSPPTVAPVTKPKPAAPAPTSEVALNLVRKGEVAFAQQDYSTAIANAKAALDVQPGLARAKQLLREAQQAQQQAMNSISIQ
jgi:hypothetical protein